MGEQSNGGLGGKMTEISQGKISGAIGDWGSKNRESPASFREMHSGGQGEGGKKLRGKQT